MDLLDNNVSSEDSDSMGVPYGQNWDRNNFRSGPMFRWLSVIFVS